MIALEVVGALAAVAGTALVFHMVLSLDRATSHSSLPTSSTNPTARPAAPHAGDRRAA